MKMDNPYHQYLMIFFETITDFKHTSSRLNQVLLKDVEKYTTEEARFYSGTSLFISDWTGPTDNGWELPFYSGSDKETKKENYAIEVEKLLSREFGFFFAQCYESLEAFLKDCINSKINSNELFKEAVKFDNTYTRDNLKGGNKLFILVKKASGNRFRTYSKENNNNFRFKEIFTIFSEARHSITHSKGYLKKSKIPETEYYKLLFKLLFPKNELKEDLILLQLDYDILNKLLVHLAEFGFQIYKALSEEDNHEWKI